MHVFPDMNGRADVTWYQKSGLIAHKGQIYYAHYDDVNKDRLGKAADVRSRVRVLDADTHPIMRFLWYIMVIFIDVEGAVECNITVSRCKTRYSRSITLWLNVQALIKIWACRRIAEKKAKQLAFAMAWHERLGSECAVAAVPVDLTEFILALLQVRL